MPVHENPVQPSCLLVLPGKGHNLIAQELEVFGKAQRALAFTKLQGWYKDLGRPQFLKPLQRLAVTNGYA